jgi:phosphoserine aminotransferase
MLVIEDYLDALHWAERTGGLPALIARADANAAIVDRWVGRTPWIRHLAADPATRSNTSVCLAFEEGAVPAGDQAALAKAIAARLEAEGAAYDIGSYRDAPPGLRIWCGSTVEASDLAALMPWLDWAYAMETGRS